MRQDIPAKAKAAVDALLAQISGAEAPPRSASPSNWPAVAPSGSPRLPEP
ncbi:hypothetical protein [Tessaracoccus flavescens]|nr:hypothetical protein [Tessaracoccus flavescens]